MAQFLLIHGAAHGAWCWRDVIPALQARGHGARAIDLPSHGSDPTPIGEVTLQRYVGAIEAALPDDPVVLVGHSMGGYPITALAQRTPDRLARLVYLCAYVPAAGRSLAGMRHDWHEQPLAEAIRLNDDDLSMHFDPALVPDKFYHDCAPEARAFAAANLCDQPLAPMREAVGTGDAYSRVPRSYIVCANDRAIPSDYQRHMARGFDADDIHTLNTAHSPFLAAPDTLAALLDAIVSRQPL